VLSNVIGPIVTYSSSQVSLAVVLASGLSFLGLGVSPPTADWGLMLNTLRQSLYVAPMNAVLPGLVILITSVCFNLFSDGLRSALDVKP
jgi:peptide/nickel transport system permease protein